MEKLSRVKKYEELRKSIETDNHVDASTDEQDSREALKSFDSSLFKRVNIQEETPAKRAQADVEEPEASTGTVNDTFTNEYLDDFIREVREYNIRKGNRESEDTEVDILYQLNAVNRAKRTRYVQPIQDETLEPEDTLAQDTTRQVLSREEIAQEVQNLLLADEVDEDLQKAEESMTVTAAAQPQEQVAEEKEPPMTAVGETTLEVSGIACNSAVPDSEKAFEDDEDETDEVVEETLQRRLIEETQQLRIQLDEYEEELSDLNDGVERNNRILNFILCFLILVLLAIIGYIVYMIWQTGAFGK